MNNYLFQSSRLGFRKWQEEDIAPFAVMCGDPVVMKYFPKTLSPEETAEHVNRYNAHFEEKGYCFFAVDLLPDQSFAGVIGLSTPRFDAAYQESLEIGWRLRKDIWGQGLATEGATRCLQYGFETLKFPEILAITSRINTPSIRVMEKIGMKFTGTFDHPNIEAGSPLQKHVLYTIKQ